MHSARYTPYGHAPVSGKSPVSCPHSMPAPGNRSNRTVRRGRISPLFIISLLVNLALAGGLAYVLYLKPLLVKPSGTGSGGTSTASPEAVVALGRVQPAGGVISVFGPPGDRVTKLNVEL